MSQLERMAQSATMVAGEMLRQLHFGVEHRIETKSSATDLVSNADRDAEEMLRARLLGERPHDGFWGEESGFEPGSSGLVWIVDPLDGTAGFLAGLPLWAVSVACCEIDSPEIGIRVAERALAGAVWSLPGMITPAPGVPVTDNLQQAYLFANFSIHNPAQRRLRERLAGEVGHLYEVRTTALSLRWLAAGRSHLYFQRGAAPWDWAAGIWLCRKSGLSARFLPETDELPAGYVVGQPKLVGQLAQRL